MTRRHRSRLWLALALVAVLIVAAALWLRGTLPGGSSRPAPPTPAVPGASPLPIPTSPTSVRSSPPSWASGGAVLLWVVLGIGLALGIAFIIVRRHRHDTE